MSDNTTTVMFVVAFTLIAAQSIAVILFSKLVMSLSRRVKLLEKVAPPLKEHLNFQDGFNLEVVKGLNDLSLFMNELAEYALKQAGKSDD